MNIFTNISDWWKRLNYSPYIYPESGDMVNHVTYGECMLIKVVDMGINHDPLFRIQTERGVEIVEGITLEEVRNPRLKEEIK